LPGPPLRLKRESLMIVEAPQSIGSGAPKGFGALSLKSQL
jgi:hypothetical protein